MVGCEGLSKLEIADLKNRGAIFDGTSDDRESAYAEGHSMDELDRRLKDLAEITKQYPLESLQRKKAIQRLLQAIRQSGKLFCEGRYDYPSEVYHDALQSTLHYVAKKINEYDPTQAKMMTWVNRRLAFAFIDEIRRFKKERERKSKEISFSKPYSEDNGSTLEDCLSSDETPYLSDQVRQIIERDPEGLFRARHLRGRPEISFQVVALYLMDDSNKRRLAKNLNVREQTLYSFFRRACIEMCPHIKRYLQNL
jgi:hypothetical protein